MADETPEDATTAGIDDLRDRIANLEFVAEQFDDDDSLIAFGDADDGLPLVAPPILGNIVLLGEYLTANLVAATATFPPNSASETLPHTPNAVVLGGATVTVPCGQTGAQVKLPPTGSDFLIEVVNEAGSKCAVDIDSRTQTATVRAPAKGQSTTGTLRVKVADGPVSITCRGAKKDDTCTFSYRVALILSRKRFRRFRGGTDGTYRPAPDAATPQPQTMKCRTGGRTLTFGLGGEYHITVAADPKSDCPVTISGVTVAPGTSATVAVRLKPGNTVRIACAGTKATDTCIFRYQVIVFGPIRRRARVTSR